MFSLDKLKLGVPISIPKSVPVSVLIAWTVTSNGLITSSNTLNESLIPILLGSGLYNLIKPVPFLSNKAFNTNTTLP